MYHKAIPISICSPWSVVQHGSLDLFLQCFLLDCRASFYRLEQIQVAEIQLCIIIKSEICLRIIIETKITELKGKSIEFEGEIRLCVIIESEIKEQKVKSIVNFYLEFLLFLAKKFEQKYYKRYLKYAKFHFTLFSFICMHERYLR